MADLPIIFSGPMIRALIEGRKTQTRRLRFDNHGRLSVWGKLADAWRIAGERDHRLWVRETWCEFLDHHDGMGDCVYYRANQLVETKAGKEHRERCGVHWRPSIHMPRRASRLTLTVTDTKIERLQDISEEDARAEGARRFDDIPVDRAHLPHQADRWSMTTPAHTGECLRTAEEAFANYWIALHGPTAWDENPEVVPISFTVEQRNIDA